ncbi:helix-turn-helix transcriptional regulator [Pararhizobium sp. BT-229]|uniref:helix-turn-helix transcriptional regulator n=1 Tax=Pararhizobium sp. BT-229 TaxID=2986923 RepID=UPI0021F70188|nr:helix-turn-helix transcriptional regulator [Pararhizobium sp. BT-229]MCV9965812.1 helix-turn-helix transcriptional regulator [Pararhizobium sp. BT-229]
MAETPALIDRIYEAAVIPELWPDVCVSLAAEVNGFSAALLTIDTGQTVRWVCSPNIDEQMERYSRSELRFLNPRPERSLRLSPTAFARDVDVMTAEEIAADPVYNAFLRPLGLGWSMGAVLPEPSGHTLIFDMIGWADNGPFSVEALARINSLKGDLARAALVSSRMIFRQAQTIAATLSMIGLPAAVLGDGNRVLATNEDMEALAPRIRTGAADKLSLENPAANALLLAALEQVRIERVANVQSIPLPAVEEAPALILHVLPLRRNARDIFSKSLAVLIATPVGQAGPPDMRVLSGLFDLTPGEARVARELASGASLETVALALGLTLETVRTYLKRIFFKTGTRRQAELTHLLSGLGRLAT